MASTALIFIETFFLLIICIGALTGNFLLFVLVFKTPALQTTGNVFILNLAVADLLVSLVNMPITIVTVISQDWILGEEVCLMSGFVTLLTFVASCMALSMISINRYHAIVHWTKYHEKYTNWKCALYVGIVWAITVGLSLPPLLGWAKFSYDPGQSYCFAEWTASKSYTLFMIATCLLGPTTVMSYCYVKILRFKKDSRRRVLTVGQADEITVTTASVANTVQPISRQTAAARTDRKLTRTIMTLIVVFMLCWSPFAIVMLVQVFIGTSVPRWIDFGSLILGYLNSFCNVIVYNATNKYIRLGYRKLLGFKPNQIDVGNTGIS